MRQETILYVEVPHEEVVRLSEESGPTSGSQAPLA